MVCQFLDGLDRFEGAQAPVFGVVVPLMVGLKLRIITHMDICRQSIKVLEETVLVGGRVEFNESNIQLKMIFWRRIADGR